MSTIAGHTVGTVLDRLAAATPSPGGGVAAALAGALGAAVAEMCASLPRTRHGRPDERSRLYDAARDLAVHRARLVQLAEDDGAAVTALMSAGRLPADTDRARAARHEALGEAARRATRVPLETVRVCAAALECLREVAAHAARVAESDVNVAIGLLKTSADGAASNVRANLRLLDDEAWVRDTTRELSRALDGVARGAHDAAVALRP